MHPINEVKKEIIYLIFTDSLFSISFAISERNCIHAVKTLCNIKFEKPLKTSIYFIENFYANYFY